MRIDFFDFSLKLATMRVLFHNIGGYRAATRLGPSSFPHHDLFVLREGRLDFASAHGHIELAAGDAVVISPGLTFQAEAIVGPARPWVLHFELSGRERRLYGLGVRKPPRYLPGAAADPEDRRHLERIRSIYLESGGDLRQARLDHHAAWLLGEWIARDRARNRQPPTHDPVERARRRALELLQDGSPSVREMAYEAGLSPSHFRARFQQLYGEPPRAWLFRERMRQARDLLTQTDEPIKAIADQLGYADTVAFHHAFAAYTGQTPADCRKSTPPIS